MSCLGLAPLVREAVHERHGGVLDNGVVPAFGMVGEAGLCWEGHFVSLSRGSIWVVLVPVADLLFGSTEVVGTLGNTPNLIAPGNLDSVFL
jgi:hypothetical protein